MITDEEGKLLSLQPFLRIVLKWMTTAMRMTKIIIRTIAVCITWTCLSMGHPNDSLCEQNTPHRRAERQWDFIPTLPSSDWTNSRISRGDSFSSRFFSLLPVLLFRRDWLPNSGWETRSKPNSFATEVKPFPWKCLKTDTTPTVLTFWITWLLKYFQGD